MSLSVAGFAAQLAGPLDINMAQREQAQAWLAARLQEAGFAAGEAEVEVVAGEPAQEILAAEQRGHMDLMRVPRGAWRRRWARRWTG